MYKVFNMGIGFVIIADREESQKILNCLNKDYDAYKIGEVISEDKIIINTFDGIEIQY